MVSSPLQQTAAWIGRAGLLGSLLLTSACASVPDLGAKPEPRAASAFAASASLAAPTSAWPADGWWLGYGDPQLAHLMSEALAGSPATSGFRQPRVPG